MKLPQLKQIIKEEIEEVIKGLTGSWYDNRGNMSPYDQGVKDAILAVMKFHPDLDIKAVVDIIQGDGDDSTPPIVNETEGKNKYFIIVNFKGQSDELGNFHGIEVSDKNDFTQKFKNIFKDDINDYYTFYEVPNKQMMDKIVKLSDQWEGGEDTRETKMLQNIADKAKKFNRLNL